MRIKILNIDLNRIFFTNYYYKNINLIILSDILTYRYIITYSHSVEERHCVEYDDGNIIVFYA